MSTTLFTRVSNASKILGISEEKILEALKEEGIEDTPIGISILDAQTTGVDDLVDILRTCSDKAKTLQLRAAASQLKSSDTRPQPELKVAQQPTLTEVLKNIKPIAQWNDRDLLEEYVKTKDPEIENELHKRAKNGPFVVLKPGKYDPGKEEIDIDLTLELLKNARKKVNPTYIPNGKIFSNVFKITELNPDDRIIELCPFCGEPLYKGFCQKCQINLSGCADDERAYLKLISESGNFQVKSLSDRNAVIASAQKGLDDLKLTWPSLAQRFDELKLTNSLPKLRIIENRPSVADPYFQNGNRSFGHKVF